MKKATIILLSLLMVLAVGQAAFAKGSVGLVLGYEARMYDDESGNSLLEQNGLRINATGSYNLTEKISLAGEIGTTIFFNKDSKEHQFTTLTLSLFGRYNLFSSNIINTDLQLGLIDNLEFDNKNSIFIAPGVFAEVNVTSKLSLYTDLKIPLVVFIIDGEYSSSNFLKAFFYDVKLGATYEVSPKISLGIEGSISNSNTPSIDALNGYKDFTWSIGAKVGYRF